MSNSSPADLAVAFRSLPRRLKEASTDHASPEAVAAAGAMVDRAVHAAAQVLSCAASPEAVAAGIQARHARDWTEADLAAIQVSANDAARAIRGLQTT